jgi:sulfofructose kinase
MGRDIEILGIGVVAVDHLLFVDDYPPADAKARILHRERQCGGLAATALVAAARLGGRCAYAGVLGDDELSRFALDVLGREKIDTSRTKRVRDAEPVSSWIVVSRRHGSRTIFYDLSRYRSPGERWPSAAVIRSSGLLLVDHVGVPGMLRAARIARRHGVPVVADFERSDLPGFEALLACADHLIVSLDFARKTTGQRTPEAALRKLWSPDREVVAVTAGAAGCWYCGAGGTSPRHQRAFKVRAVDTTGCGDVFHGAYAFGLSAGLPLPERIRLAAATAALKATRPGGQNGLPSLREVKHFMAQTKEA